MCLLLEQPAPIFGGSAIVNGSRTYLHLSNYTGSYLVAIFIPREFIFHYPPWLYAISNKLTDYRSINCEIIAITSVNEHFNLPWKMTNKKYKRHLKFPVVMDVNGIIARSYGSIAEINVIYVGGLFIIDPQQKLRYYIDIDADLGPIINTLTYVESLQNFDRMVVELEKRASN